MNGDPKPMIYNRDYTPTNEGTTFRHDFSRRKPTGRRSLKPWVVNYGGQEYAIAFTQPDAVAELSNLQWGGIIPEPGKYQ